MKVRDLPVYVIESSVSTNSPRQFLESLINGTVRYVVDISDAMVMNLEQATKLQDLLYAQPSKIVCLIDWNK